MLIILTGIPNLHWYGEEGDYNTRTEHEENTTVAVTSLVDQIIINNIEEEEDENIDTDVDKEPANKIEYSPETHPSRRMNKTLSQASNMGKD